MSKVRADFKSNSDVIGQGAYLALSLKVLAAGGVTAEVEQALEKMATRYREDSAEAKELSKYVSELKGETPKAAVMAPRARPVAGISPN